MNIDRRHKESYTVHVFRVFVTRWAAPILVFWTLSLLFLFQERIVRNCQIFPEKSTQLKSSLGIQKNEHVEETIQAGLFTKKDHSKGNSFFENEYPRVYIVPMPREYNWDLLNCSYATAKESSSSSNNEKQKHAAWFAKNDDIVRFQEINPQLPFGELTFTGTRSSFDWLPTSAEYTLMHPHPVGGEYDFEVYFHNMMKGYFNRVDLPEDADLFYVPIYSTYRQDCHSMGQHHVHTNIRRILTWWMQKYRPNTSGGTANPNFFAVAAQQCSCEQNTECNPLHGSELENQLRLLSWGRYSNPSEKEGNLVIPYPTQLHDLSAWSVHDDRDFLLLGILGKKRKNCVVCGPCGSAWDISATKDQCRPECVNIRDELIDHMRLHNHKNDIVLWTSVDNPNTTWFPEKEKSKTKTKSFWPPVNITERMLSSTFCLQPAGDTLSRKSFFDSLQVGCIPVVFRNDDAYLEQLPYPSIIPYREIYYYIPEVCIVEETCFIQTKTEFIQTNSFVDVIRHVSSEEIYKRRQLIKQYGRMLMYSSNDRKSGGYNDVNNPDAFLVALKETWRLAHQEHNT